MVTLSRLPNLLHRARAKMTVRKLRQTPSNYYYYYYYYYNYYYYYYYPPYLPLSPLFWGAPY